MDVTAALEDVQASVGAIDRSICSHPYPLAFGDGSAPLSALSPFLASQYQGTRVNARSLALLTNRFDLPEANSYFQDIQDSETAGAARILKLAAAVELRKETLLAYKADAKSFGFSAFVSFLASHGTAAEAACCFSLNLMTWGANCRRIGEGLRIHYGVHKEDLVFLLGYDASPAIDERVLKIVQTGLDQGESAETLARQAVMLQGFEKLYWDGMWEQLSHTE